MRTAFIALLLIGLSRPLRVVAQETAQTERVTLIDKAVGELNGGRPNEAKATLEDLMRRYPDAFRAYALYWSAVGSTESSVVRVSTIRRHLDELGRVPDQKRTEEYDSTVLRGHSELDDTAHADLIRAEAAKK